MYGFITQLKVRSILFNGFARASHTRFFPSIRILTDRCAQKAKPGSPGKSKPRGHSPESVMQDPLVR